MNREEILNTAKNCVCKDRNMQYGDPEDNFSAIAAFWGNYLWHSKPELQKVIAPNEIVNSSDVANMMALFKIARIATGVGTEDSYVDLAGYAACGGEIATKWDRGEELE